MSCEKRAGLESALYLVRRWMERRGVSGCDALRHCSSRAYTSPLPIFTTATLFTPTTPALLSPFLSVFIPPKPSETPNLLVGVQTKATISRIEFRAWGGLEENALKYHLMLFRSQISDTVNKSTA